MGIEVPNEEMSLVALREVVENEAFTRGRMSLRFALGKDVAGHPKAANLEAMPHLLIAGTTGSGKSVCVNSILTCFLLHNTPDDLRLILVDPKRVELTGYNGVPHLLAPVVVEIERVIGALQWMTREMDNRYHKFAEIGARNIQDYNKRVSSQGGKRLPYLVIVIDELADLMMIAPDETERTITRLAQLARATGIHMILATQRPSVDVVTGLIKANFPARIAFAVASNTDSRVILDQPGAERLLGRGDMLFQAPDAPAPVRLQGVFVSDMEINRLVDFWRTQAGAASPYAAAGTPSMPADVIPQGVPLKQVPMFEDITALQGDPLMNDAIDICRREGRGSVSMLQRKLRIGYTRAARMVDSMEEKGILGPPELGDGCARGAGLRSRRTPKRRLDFGYHMGDLEVAHFFIPSTIHRWTPSNPRSSPPRSGMSLSEMSSSSRGSRDSPARRRISSCSRTKRDRSLYWSGFPDTFSHSSRAAANHLCLRHWCRQDVPIEVHFLGREDYQNGQKCGDEAF